MDEVKGSISEKVAIDQMNKFLDFYGIDKDDLAVEEGPEKVQTLYNRLIRAIRDGCLEISDTAGEFKVIQHLKHAPGDIKQIEYSELSSKHKLAMDSVPESKSNARMHAFMGSVSGLGAQAFGNLRGADMGIMEKLAVLFMVV